MFFYIAVSFFLGVIGFIELLGILSGRLNRVLFSVSCFIMLFFSTIRWNTGTDWDAYLYYFDHINLSSSSYWIQDFEPGVRLINVLVREMGGSFTTLQFIWAIIVCIAQKKSINGINIIVCDENKNKYDLYPFNNLAFMCLWFLYFSNIFTVRTTVAYSLLLMSIPYAIKKKFIPFALINFFAFLLIHRSCILFWQFIFCLI